MAYCRDGVDVAVAGNFLGRVATNGQINAPWGLAIAPSGFGTFGGDLLVGNLYDSKVDAYNLTTDHLDGLNGRMPRQ